MGPPRGEALPAPGGASSKKATASRANVFATAAARAPSAAVVVMVIDSDAGSVTTSNPLANFAGSSV